ncbi:MAG TPA: bifunctional lytic transglycosylase/C40 family peptidase [Streptosporangiaceae bacterium]|nr:bifunctional lytic transglycosylase/C40 family peptidase [Streptosporangiaceae bacterium]
MSRMAVLAAAAFIVVPLVLMLLAAGGESSPLAASTAAAPTALAQDDIPPDYLAWYQAAAQTCPGLPWQVLAGIGTVESGNGESAAPGVHAGANFAGAEGPMQFEPATFTEYAVNADPGQPLSPYDPQDAIWTAAAMLCANGARGGTTAGIRQAVYAYNHATWYVNEVLAWAAKFAQPVTASPVAAQAIAYAEQQIGKPYVWGADGPDAFDCSGLVYAAYASAGVAIARTTFGWRQDGPVVPLSDLQPGDLLFYAGSDGSATDPGHVVMYLGAGQVIQAPEQGEDVQTDPVDLAGVIVATRPAALATTEGGTP